MLFLWLEVAVVWECVFDGTRNKVVSISRQVLQKIFDRQRKGTTFRFTLNLRFLFFVYAWHNTIIIIVIHWHVPSFALPLLRGECADLFDVAVALSSAGSMSLKIRIGDM
jgi:hypothetical protein